MSKRTLLDSLRARGITLPSEIESGLPDDEAAVFADDQADDDDPIARIAAKVRRLLGED